MSTEPPPPGRRPSGVVTGLLVATVVGLWLLLWAEFLVAVPHAKRQFDEYGLKLPDLTRAVIGAGQWATSNAFLVLPAALAGAVAFGALMGAFRHRPRWTATVTVVALLLLTGLCAANVVVAGALALPAEDLRKGLVK